MMKFTYLNINVNKLRKFKPIPYGQIENRFNRDIPEITLKLITIHVTTKSRKLSIRF
jgi:hypothetical protein